MTQTVAHHHENTNNNLIQNNPININNLVINLLSIQNGTQLLFE